MKINKKITLRAIEVTLVVGALVGAYVVGVKSGTDSAQRYYETFDEESAVTQRVSEQMADIAQQQKEVSDEQRALAEQESEVARQAEAKANEHAVRAEQMAEEAQLQRDEANHQREVAQMSQRLAEEQKDIAQKNQRLAQRQQQIAEEKRDQADLARRIADTLNYRTLGKNLGNSAVSQYQGNHTDLANTLAYASYYFLNTYKADTYQPNTFKALSSCSNTKHVATMEKKGAVCAVTPYDDKGFIAVSDYGEMEWVRSLTTRKLSEKLIQNSEYNFRDVCVNNHIIYALSLHGPLLVVNPAQARKTEEVDLPEDSYLQVFCENENSVLVVGKYHLCSYNLNTKQLTSTKLTNAVSVAVRRENNLYLFFQDGTYKICLPTLKPLKPLTPLKPLITAAYYDKKTKCLFLGHDNGDVDIVNRDNVLLHTLCGHNSRITKMGVWNDLLITTSYDKTMRIWNLQNVNASKEWVVGVDYKYNGWPLSLCFLKNTSTLVVGTSDGTIQQMEVSIRKLAETVKSNMRNLTSDEWNQYVGVSIPYQRFK